MEYSITQLAQMAGISGRTLRYYDQIGLLKPSRVNEAGYRFYGTQQVDMLQQILFYRELGMALSAIGTLLAVSGFDRIKVMEAHLSSLESKRERLDALIDHASRTLRYWKGELPMSDKDKFEGLQKRLVEENEEKYGTQAREAYGAAAVDAARDHFLGLDEAGLTRQQLLEKEILRLLAAAAVEGKPAGELAQKACAYHKEWLTLTTGQYSKEYHLALADMYVADPRFAAYYDADVPGCAALLREAIQIFCK